MLKPEMSKSEIERDLAGKGNFVQIDHLNRFLKDHSINMDTKKFIFLKLATLYEGSKLFGETAKAYENAASISLTFSDKIKHYTKAAEAYSRLGAFDRVDEAIRRAMAEANNRERMEIQNTIKQIYFSRARTLEAEQKRSHAVKFYEKLMEMRLTEQEKTETRAKLADLYNRLGKVRESKLAESR